MVGWFCTSSSIVLKVNTRYVDVLVSGLFIKCGAGYGYLCCMETNHTHLGTYVQIATKK